MNHKAIKLFPDQDLPSFAVIRDPADRIRSWWVWHKKHKKLDDWYAGDFDEWCMNGFKTHWTEDDCKIMGITHALKQWDYVTIDGRVAVDYLVDYNRIQNELKKIANKLKIKMGRLLVMGKSGEIKVSDKVKFYCQQAFPEDYELYERITNE